MSSINRKIKEGVKNVSKDTTKWRSSMTKPAELLIINQA